MNKLDDTIEEKVLGMISSGKSHEEILSSFVNERSKVEGILGTINSLEDFVGPSPDPSLLQAAIVEVNKQTVTKMTESRLNNSEQARLNRSSFINSLNQIFSMRKSFAFAGSGLVAILLVVGLWSLISQNSNTSLVSLPELEQNIASEIDSLDSDLEELDSFLVAEIDLESDLLALADLESVSPEGVTSGIADLASEVEADLDSLLEDLEELEGFENESTGDVDTELGELFS